MFFCCYIWILFGREQKMWNKTSEIVYKYHENCFFFLDLIPPMNGQDAEFCNIKWMDYANNRSIYSRCSSDLFSGRWRRMRVRRKDKKLMNFEVHWHEIDCIYLVESGHMRCKQDEQLWYFNLTVVINDLRGCGTVLSAKSSLLSPFQGSSSTCTL